LRDCWQPARGAPAIRCFPLLDASDAVRLLETLLDPELADVVWIAFFFAVFNRVFFGG
jgi:hypothetical protein